MELRPHQEVALQELRNGSGEEWAEIRGFPEYLISNYGRVYSCRNDIILKPGLSSAGYFQVIFSVSGVYYYKTIHRLVAEAFVPGWDIGLEVNHIDGDKTNNYEDNLEWATQSENSKHAFRIGLHPNHRKKKIIVNESGEIFDSITACAKNLKTHRCVIANVLAGRSESWKGYTFSYVE